MGCGARRTVWSVVAVSTPRHVSQAILDNGFPGTTVLCHLASPTSVSAVLPPCFKPRTP